MSISSPKIEIEIMTQDEIVIKGYNLQIQYSVFNMQFGLCLVATTNKGICAVLFSDTKEAAIKDLSSRWPNAKLMHRINPVHLEVANYFKSMTGEGDASESNVFDFKLHLQGTDMQIKVWNALLAIPPGKTSTYTEIAEAVGNKKLSRVVGTMIGKNHIGYIIPCHRVLKSTGELGGYKWGTERKKKMLEVEGVK